MNSSKNPLSAFRYFKAGLKPFRKFSFWGPPSAIAIVALCYWQYRSNPAWLNTSFEQPEGVENVLSNDPTIPAEQEIGLEMPLQSIAREAQTQQAQEQLPLVDPLSPQGITSPTQQNESSTASGSQTLGLGSQLTPNKQDETKEDSSKTSSIFIPLMPNVKNPSSIFSNNSNSQRQNNTANPPALSPIDGLMKPKPVTVTDNPLQNAMEQNATNDAASNTELNSATTPSQTQTPTSEVSGVNSRNASSNPSPQPQQTNNNFSNPSTATQSLTQNSQPQPPYYYSPPGNTNSAQSNIPSGQGYQNPYLNAPVQTNPAQSSPQSYNNAYPAPFPIPGGASQAPAQSYPNPYLNNPVPQTPQVTQNQFNQPNYTNSPAGTAQVQRAIEEFGSD
jgi:hypothetical protein